jgi:hypothetical protein
MLAEDSPFRSSWWGVSLASEPDEGSFGPRDFRGLPPLPFALTGDLAWLAGQPQHEKWAVGAEPKGSLSDLLLATERLGVTLPPTFLTFLGNPSLQRRVRSATRCFVDLGPAPSPAGDGYLIRFLGDLRGSQFWYLYVTADGSDHAVVFSPVYYGGPEEDVDDEYDSGDIHFCAESFESFLGHYWLENEIHFARADGTPLPPGAREYLAMTRP